MIESCSYCLNYIFLQKQKSLAITYNVHLLLLNFLVHLNDPHQGGSCNTKNKTSFHLIIKLQYSPPSTHYLHSHRLSKKTRTHTWN